MVGIFLLSEPCEGVSTLDEALEILFDRSVELEKYTAKKPTKKEPETVDFTSLSSKELMNKPIPGIASEKIDPAIEAIMTYNNEIAPSNQERWAVTITCLGTISSRLQYYWLFHFTPFYTPLS